MRCIRCPQNIETDAPANVVICGSCADDLRQEEDATTMAAETEAEHIMFEMNKEAYEDAQHDAQYDSGNGYRYI